MRPRVVLVLVAALALVCAVLYVVGQNIGDESETCFAADSTPTTIEFPC